MQRPPTSQDNILIRNLRQQYGAEGKVALHDLCLGIPKGECFGYLGINGAGKSTTLKILTGQIAPSSGSVFLGGFDLAHDRDRARTVIGYCPQFDALHDLLTVREQLELYAELKGIRGAEVQDAVAQKIKEVGLDEYADKLTRGLSGGNKRKVSTAIALMGSPQIVFLDEPSTGVDPSARRKMWDVIAAVCASKQASVVLTTHSMEECEALCTRVGILVSGRLRCLGSVQHLKHKYGNGYTVEVKLHEPAAPAVNALVDRCRALLRDQEPLSRENVVHLCAALGNEQYGHAILGGQGNGWVLSRYLQSSKTTTDGGGEGGGAIPLQVFCLWWLSETASDRLVQFFDRELRGSTLVERQGDHLHFQVPRDGGGLRPFEVFGLLEQSKKTLDVGEYSVSETSLEHIFNGMAAQQEEETLPPAYHRRHSSKRCSNRTDDDNMRLRRQSSSRQSVRSFHRCNTDGQEAHAF